MDDVVAKGSSLPPLPMPNEGTTQGVLVDIVDLKYHEETYQGQPKGWQHKIAFIWQIDQINPETKKPFEVWKEFTLSMNDRANLRKFLGQWRGRSYTDEEAEAGVPLKQLAGANCIMQIEHQAGKADPKKKYVNIITIMRAPASVERMFPDRYERQAWWAKKIGKEESQIVNTPATEQAIRDGQTNTFDDFPAALEDQDDDLPF